MRFAIQAAADCFSSFVEVSASRIFGHLEANWLAWVVLLAFGFHDSNYLQQFRDTIGLLSHHKSILQYYSNEFPIVPDTG